MPFNLLSIYQLYQKLSLERQREGKIARAKNKKYKRGRRPRQMRAGERRWRGEWTAALAAPTFDF